MLNDGTPRSPEQLRRLLRAFLASTATGVIVYFLVTRLALPALASKLSPEGREWLRHAWAGHPYWVLIGVVAISAFAALPVLITFRLVHGPFRK